MRYLAFITAWLVILTLSCQKNSNNINLNHPHYEISLSVDPDSSYIQVEGKLTLPYPADSIDSIGFCLERHLQIEHFTMNNTLDATIDTAKSDNRFMPEARKVYFKPGEDVKNSEPAVIRFAYHGQLATLPDIYGNRIQKDWVEIGLYYPWFPTNYEEMGKFTYSVNVANVKGYKTFSVANVKNKADLTVLSCNIPTNDIAVCMSTKTKTFVMPMGENQLKIYHHSFNDSLLKHMSGSIVEMVNRYNQWFGGVDTDISIIETQRKSGGGYARAGGMVLGGIDPEKYFERERGYHRYFAHELAHLWWRQAQANIWEDWLNESFAEYSALLSLRETFGEETFQKYIDHKKEKSANTPPIWHFDRNGAPYDTAYQVLYNKGPVLLGELETKIGSPAFISLCKTMTEQKTARTNDFLAILEKQNGAPIAKWFEQELKTK